MRSIAPRDTEVRITLARRLREEQQRTGLTVERLAALSGVGARMLGYYRAAERLPRWTTVLRLAAALGVEPASLLTPTCDEPGDTPARSDDPPVDTAARARA